MSPVSLHLRFLRAGLVVCAAGAIALRAMAADPVLVLSLVEPEHIQTWSPGDLLAIRVEVRHPGMLDDTIPRTPLVLAPEKRSWTEAVSLRVSDAEGREVPWAFARSGPTGITPLTITLGGGGAMSFILSPEASKAVPPGRYGVQASLAIRDGSGWRGHVASAPLELAIAPPAPHPSTLDLALVGAESLMAGDVPIVSIHSPFVPGASEDAYRTGYRIAVRDATGRELSWGFDPAASPPVFPSGRQLAERGFGPVLLVASTTGAGAVQPGRYRARVTWAASPRLPTVEGEIEFEVKAGADAEPTPERSSTRVSLLLARATAGLWRAEYSRTAEIEALVGQAAPLLVEAERLALAAFAARPEQPESAAAIAEVYLAQGDFDGAAAFARVALGLWSPPERPADISEDEWAPPPPEGLRGLVREIAERAAKPPGRVLPYLRTALTASRGTAGVPKMAGSLARPPVVAPSPAAGPSAPSARPETGPAAQWATSARASSEYRGTDYSASQAAGAPDVPRHGDSGRAWAPKLADGGEEWIELTYSTPVRATGVRVVQNYKPGAIVRIDLIDEAGAATTVWRGPDSAGYGSNTIGLLETTFPPTDRPIVRVKVVLDTKRVPDWNEIDAVQLLGATP